MASKGESKVFAHEFSFASTVFVVVAVVATDRSIALVLERLGAGLLLLFLVRSKLLDGKGAVSK